MVGVGAAVGVASATDEPRAHTNGADKNGTGITSDEFNKPIKFTYGSYFYTDQARHYTGQDFNLRFRHQDTSTWIGQYHDSVFGRQTRAGADHTWQSKKYSDLSIQTSMQVATRGLFGGSINVQYGQAWYGLVGWGRTNLRPYQNLNFDPNDALTLGVGFHQSNGNSYSLTTIWDDRLHTGQRHSHAVGQFLLSERHRLTLDLLRKTGHGDNGAVSVWGGLVTYDFIDWFVRAAWDPKQNFGIADAARLSVGRRF